MLISPRRVEPSSSLFATEPMISNRIASLITSWPYTCGAKEAISLSYASGLFAIVRICFSFSVRNGYSFESSGIFGNPAIPPRY